MNRSIQRRLSLWLSVSILAAGILAALTSFIVAYHDSTVSQDALLQEVAGALSRGSYKDVPPEALPRDVEEAENRFLIAGLGTRLPAGAEGIDLALPATMPDGIQTFSQDGVDWRVMVIHDSFGERFGVAQSMEARDEDALAGALYILIPIALLVPLLLWFVHVILKRSFEPLVLLSREVDRVDGISLAALHDATVPAEIVPFVQAVNRLLVRLGLAFEQQRRLVTDAAHELKSPVAALMVQAQNIQSVSLSVDADQRVAVLRKGLQRLASLQDQLLSLARIQKPDSMEREILHLDGIVRSTIEDILPTAVAKGVDLGCTRLDDVRIVGDLQHAESLIRNAIDNAVRYTPSGGAVDISLGQEGRAACFVVEDTGPGIDPSDLARVFEPFVRILGTKEAGSGLGLAIVRGAAQAMGGSVELTARQDERPGLRFVYRQAAA